MGLESVSRDVPPRATEGSLAREAWGVYSLGRPVPSWVSLHVVLNGVTAEKGGRENQNLPCLHFHICACPHEKKAGRHPQWQREPQPQSRAGPRLGCGGVWLWGWKIWEE